MKKTPLFLLLAASAALFASCGSSAAYKDGTYKAQYKDPEVLRGRRVLVVGAGNTGCDIAVDSAQNAARTLHSTRRGYWYSPKFAFGRPSDQIADLLLALRVPLAVRRMLFRLTIGLTVGDLRRFGIAAPDHDFFQTHPIVNQQLPYYVGHGDILPKPDVRRFDGDTVTFADGTSEEIDVAVFATDPLCGSPQAASAAVASTAAAIGATRVSCFIRTPCVRLPGAGYAVGRRRSDRSHPTAYRVGASQS